MIVDVTGIELMPGNHGLDCMGNGEHTDKIECCCDECDYTINSLCAAQAAAYAAKGEAFIYDSMFSQTHKIFDFGCVSRLLYHVLS